MVFLMWTLLLSFHASLAALPCDGSGCCPSSNYRPGPLNLTQLPNGYDAKKVDEKAFIYRCVENFTSLLWFKEANGSYLSFPWEESGRVSLPEARHNQTLQIMPLKTEDNAVYIYFASNGTHTVTGNFTLQVNCHDTGPSFAIKEQPIQYVKLGSSKTLRCVAQRSKCEKPVFSRIVFWIWRDINGNESMLSNETGFVNVICDTAENFGQNCSLLIDRVNERHYQGTFICRFPSEDIFQEVRLVPPVPFVVSWLPLILGIAAAVALVLALGLLVRWRYGHRIAFWCRIHPDRGTFEHDAVIVHGEDHEDLVRNHLKPRLREFGYDVMEEVAKPGKPEVLETADAILSSYCVILTFSSKELQDGWTHFLAKVSKLKAGRSVVFVRCHDSPTAVSRSANTNYHATSQDGDPDQNSLESDQKPQGEESRVKADECDNLMHKAKNIWKGKEMREFKIVDWPESLTEFKKENRQLEKFWYNLRNSLPSLVKSQHSVPQPSVDRSEFRSSGSCQQQLL